MSSTVILYIIIGIVSFGFIFEQFLDYLNMKARRLTVPEEIKAFYPEEKYKKSQEYQTVRTRFSFLTSGISFVVTLLLLFTGGFGWLDQELREIVTQPIYLALVYFAVLYVISDVATLPFQWYSTFVIEERFGFNKTTVSTFILDKLKGYLLAALMGGLLIGTLLYLIIEIGPSFWWMFWIVATVFILFMNVFYTSLIIPLFNKLTPLGDGELKDAINAYAERVNFPLDNIFVIDGSKRSSKANAFFSGIGKKKKIVLYDTLIESHSVEELVAVLAHEVGHFKKKHIVIGLVTSIVQIGLMLFIMSRMIFNEQVSIALGGEQLAIHLNLIGFGILYSPISMVLGLLGNVLSRKHEFEADAYASTTYRAEPLMEALKGLSVDNLSNLYPHRLYVFFNYSHPPLLQRLKALGDYASSAG